ncbi:MAG TPA: ATP-binding protein, partial [Pseudonocardiaceae bacterium]|nr:ATP-binding protein [Pseudonocardiaceae bacterium]
DRDLLARQAAAAKPAIEADRTRAALLAAVSHDLRTPLAAASAAVTSLRNPEVSWNAEDQAELLATADESLQRLTRLIDNLLDLSRLQAGALAVHRELVVLDELIPIALDGLGPEAAAVRWQPAPALPPVWADPVLLERVIANLVSNALRYSPASHPPMVTASALGDQAELRVIDRGPGIPDTDREHIFLPFQRFGDRDNTTGLGLGLALSRGLVEAMGGSLTPEDTPGGGLTMVVTVRLTTPEPGPAEVNSEEIPA